MSLSSKLKANKKLLPPHLIVNALAGTGKTTVLVEALNVILGIKPTITPSPQQQAIWDCIALSKGIAASDICFCAFNVSIAAELQRRVPIGVNAMTMHSLGNRAVTSAFGRLGRVHEDRVQEIIAEILNIDIRNLRTREFELVNTSKKLINLAKVNLVHPDDIDIDDQLDDIAAYHEIDLGENRSRVMELVPQVLTRCLDVDRDRRIDYTDMVYLPVVLDLPMTKYSLFMLDECADTSRVQQALAKKCGQRLVMVGDIHQAIYSWAGADAQAMLNLTEELRNTEQGLVELPLTVTRRCGKAIVREAQKIVPEFEAHPDNPEGKVTYASFKI